MALRSFRLKASFEALDPSVNPRHLSYCASCKRTFITLRPSHVKFSVVAFVSFWRSNFIASSGSSLLKSENCSSINLVQDGITVCNRVMAASHCFGLMKRTSERKAAQPPPSNTSTFEHPRAISLKW